MKKLMIGIFAAVAGLAANAGYVNWELSGVMASSGSGAANNYLAYFMVDSGAGYTGGTAFTRDAALTAIESGSLDFLSNAVFGDNGGAAEIVGGQASDYNVGEGFFTTNSEDVKSYLVILNASTVDNATKAFVTDLVDTPIPYGEGYPEFDVAGTASPEGWSSIGNAPEPTSGLLLLLGVGALALRRRRA